MGLAMGVLKGGEMLPGWPVSFVSWRSGKGITLRVLGGWRFGRAESSTFAASAGKSLPCRFIHFYVLDFWFRLKLLRYVKSLEWSLLLID